MAKTVSPGVQALRDVVEKVYRELREAKEAGEPVGWSSSKFPCELAESFGLHVGYPENQAPVLQLTVTAKLCVRLLKTWAMTTISVVIPVFPWLMLLVTVVPTKWIKMATMSSIRTVANP